MLNNLIVSAKLWLTLDVGAENLLQHDQLVRLDSQIEYPFWILLLIFRLI
jgi:hypothetical protein